MIPIDQLSNANEWVGMSECYWIDLDGGRGQRMNGAADCADLPADMRTHTNQGTVSSRGMGCNVRKVVCVCGAGGGVRS